jgi:hypothetical protein
MPCSLECLRLLRCNRQPKKVSKATAWSWLLCLLFHPEDGGNRFLQNIGIRPQHYPEGRNPNSEVCLRTKQPGSCPAGKSDLKAELRFAVAFLNKIHHLTRSCITYAVDNASLNNQGRTNTSFASQGTPRLLRSPTTHDRVHKSPRPRGRLHNMADFYGEEF